MDDEDEVPLQQVEPARKGRILNVNDSIVETTGLPPDVVRRVVAAEIAYQFAIGAFHPDDDGLGAKIRARHPELVQKALAGAGAPPSQIVAPSEHEATIVRLESGESAETVATILAAYGDLIGSPESR